MARQAGEAVTDVEIDDEPPVKLDQPVRRDTINRPPAYRGHPKHLSVVEIKLAEVHLGVTEFRSPPRALIVGECPGANTSWATPLFPHPPTSSAGRLMEMAALDPAEYLGHFYRRNLCDGKIWQYSAARRRARAIVTALFDAPRDLRVVLCGNKVAGAFDLERHGFWSAIRLESRQTAVIVPHPSGVNRVYNQREAQLMTGAWIRWAALGEEHP